VQLGLAQGYPTEAPIDIRDYLPSEIPPLTAPSRVFADVVIQVRHGLDEARRCLDSVLADRAFPLARIIVVVDDRATEPELIAWLTELATDGQIHLIRTPRRLGFAAANLGIVAAETHDVLLLSSDSLIPAGCLERLSAHAHSQRNIATVSPFSNSTSICGYPDDEGGTIAFGETPARMDEVCRTVNAGRSGDTPLTTAHCMYVRRDALSALGLLEWDRSDSEYEVAIDFCLRATAAGWQHRLAYDTFVYRNRPERPGGLPRWAQPDFERSLMQHAKLGSTAPTRFAMTAALLRQSKLPVILMVSHNLDGGVRKHINVLSERYNGTARILLLEATNRGAALSILALQNHPVLTLPSERIQDLITLLRSMNVSRIHIHHLVQMQMNIRALVERLGVPFDVTVHDYYAICPQINLLRWPDEFYCGEPGPAGCNTCIADRSSHGATDIVSWRRDRAWQFLDADRVICPSADVKMRLDRYGMGKRTIVVPHEQQAQTHWVSRTPEFSGPPLRIALIGVLADHKGARTVAEVAEATSRRTTEFHLIGHLEDNFPVPAAKLIKVTGKYQDRDIAALLKRIDPHVLWFPSPWPETYSYTLSAAIETGLPIVAADIGSFTERLSGRPLTWLVDHRGSTKDLLATFDKVRMALRDGVIQPLLPRPQTISDFYADHYLSPETRTSVVAHARRPRIAIIPERYDTGRLTPCAYIRLLQPLDHPAIGGDFEVVLTDIDAILHSNADIIVTQRHAIPDVKTVSRLADHARRSHARLVFDLDDDLLNIHASHPEAQKLKPLTRVVRHMLAIADVVWVSTTELANSVATVRPDVSVIENRLDERLWIRGPAPKPSWDDPVRILCMGTSTHARDFTMIEPILVQLKREYGDRIAIDVLGMTNQSELPAELTRIGPSIHATRSYPGFVDWLTSRSPRWHIGLAPLLDTPFNRGKSPIKAMEYAALGLTVVASDTPVYRESIADGPAGQLVANDPRHWRTAIDWLIRNQDLRQSGGTKAYEAFLAQATLSNQAETRRAALTELLARRTDRGESRRTRS
jgi:glycosyltransferase involved in cell wall biosynthesis/GT2 family glycosyltransferase